MYIQITPRSHSGAISQHTNVLAILQHGGLSLQDFHALVNGTRTTIYCFPCYKSLAHFVKTVLCSYDGCLTQLLHHRCLHVPVQTDSPIYICWNCAARCPHTLPAIGSSSRRSGYMSVTTIPIPEKDHHHLHKPFVRLHFLVCGKRL
jgi:hypothetical protein